MVRLVGIDRKPLVTTVHNLGYSLLQKQDFKKAKGFFEKAVEFNPDMKESRNALTLLDDFQ